MHRIRTTLVVATACILSVHAVAQVDFTDAQLRDFATVYIAQKDIALPCDTMIRPWLQDVGLPEERYGEILRAEIRGETPELSDDEKAALAQLRVKKTECDAAHTATVRDLCTSFGLPYDVYRQMLREYQSRVSFQQRLRSWFQQEIEKRTHD